MIYPNPQQILRCVSWTLDHVVKGDPTSKASASAFATTSHLLRHAVVRLDRDRALMIEDSRALVTLLGEIRAYLATLADEPETQALADQLAALLAAPKPQADAERPHYAGLEGPAAEAIALGEGLGLAQKRLSALRARHGERADYQRIRQLVRDYIAAQLVAEAQVIEPAFLGQGPRR